MSDKILDINNLHVEFESYEGTAEVINGIDLSLEYGETSALVGETGSGKSVTVKSILGILPEANFPEGEITYKGTDLLSLTEAERHKYRGNEISMIMQNPMNALNPVYTVGEQIVDMLKWQGDHRISTFQYIKDRISGGDDSKYRQQGISMLREVDISAPERVFESYPHELSGGMRQRILIAMALLSEPDLLIADEPGTALDVTTEEDILNLLDELVDKHGTSVLYITHDLGIAQEVANHINVMYGGEIVEQAPTTELFETPKHPYTIGLMDSIPSLSSGIGSGIPGQVPSYTDPPKACRFADRCPYAEDECHTVYPYKRQTKPNHTVACHLYDGKPTEERDIKLYESNNINIGIPPEERAESKGKIQDNLESEK